MIKGEGRGPKAENAKAVRIVDLFVDPSSPIIDVTIGNHCVAGVQLDGGVAVNLIIEQTMEELGLEGLEATNIVLHLADQRKVKPVRVLRMVKITIARLEFNTSFLVV